MQSAILRLLCLPLLLVVWSLTFIIVTVWVGWVYLVDTMKKLFKSITRALGAE